MKIFINIFSILIFIIDLLFERYSEYFSIFQISIVLSIIILLITFCMLVFFKGNFIQRFLKGIIISFTLTGFIFIFGYLLKMFLILWE
jgi:hypothetical protein